MSRDDERGTSSVGQSCPTEQPDPDTADIDLLPTLDILRALNAQDRTVAPTVGRALPELARAVDQAVACMHAGGRVHYVGAGSSGRLAVLDVAELGPTYNAPPDWFVAHLAGGQDALQQAVENAEDDAGAGAAAIEATASGADFVLGLTASGRTPYVIGALQAAQRLGASTALLSADPDTAEHPSADITIVTATGPEPITGSTRMKAGTAQKLVLTSFSTAVMVRLGRTYSHHMVSMVATNAKLRARSVRLLHDATGESEDACTRALAYAGADVKTALVHLLTGVTIERASDALASSDGQVRQALRTLG